MPYSIHVGRHRQIQKQTASGIHIPSKFFFFCFFLEFFFFTKRYEECAFNELESAVNFSVIFQILFVLEETIYTFLRKCTFSVSLCTYNIISLACESRIILPSHLTATEICCYVQKQHLEHMTKNILRRYEIINQNKHTTLQSKLSTFL